MKKVLSIILPLLLTNLIFAQSVAIKDSEDQLLLQVNDEGTDNSSLTIPSSTSPPDPTTDKLYNESGTLKWNGNTLGTPGSADGDWTVSGSNMSSTVTGKVGIGTSSPLTKLHVSGDDGLLVQGTFGNGVTQNLGAGTRLHFYPKKGAFRVGYVDGTQWDDANIGDYSFAMGYNTRASGNYSTAMGEYILASGVGSIAMGSFSVASGTYSASRGSDTEASGWASTCIGEANIASGTYSVSIGRVTTASELGSMAMGTHSTASGEWSTAMGEYTKAESYASFAIGRYNVGGGTATSWIDTDPLFELGIGTGPDNNTNNAMTVLKNGNVGIGTATPSIALEVSSTDAILIPVGTTGEQPSVPTAGMIRFNSETSKFEGYIGTGWVNLH